MRARDVSVSVQQAGENECIVLVRMILPVTALKRYDKAWQKEAETKAPGWGNWFRSANQAARKRAQQAISRVLENINFEGIDE